MPGIGVILNKNSRSNKQNPNRIERFGFIIGDKGSCHATNTLDEVHDLAHEFKERNIEILGISGGDGTNHQTLTTFLDVYKDKPLPKVALLRGGTMNNLAWQLGIKGSPEKILSDLILKYHHGEVLTEHKINMVEINGMYGFLLGVGLVERFIRIYQDVETPSPQRGMGLLIKASISAVLNGKMAQHLCERFNAKITVDGKQMPFKNYMMIFAGTMQTLGFNFRPLYRGASIPEKFQFVGISTTGRGLVSTFHKALLAKPAQSDDYVDEMAKEVILEFDEPIHYNIDGDTVDGLTEKIVMRTGPLLTIVTP